MRTFRFLTGTKGPLHEHFLRVTAQFLFGESLDWTRFEHALDEIRRRDLIPPEAREIEQIHGNSIDTTLGKWLYTSVRLLRPRVVIETGVAHGVSSWIILNALHKNGGGMLHSIDLPNRDPRQEYEVDKAGSAIGSLVPDSLRTNWQLILGTAAVELPRLVAKLPHIDIFFHDSDHSYEHMKLEFSTVLPALRQSGLIISDDVQLNPAFDEMTEAGRLKSVRFRKGGTAVKS